MGVNPAAERDARELAARRELFAVLAHEFRSPIGAIIGFEELLSEGLFGDLSGSARDALVRIRSSARQLLDLAAGLNDLSGPAEELLPTPAATEPAALLRDVLEAVSQEAAGRDTLVLLDGDADIPPVMTDLERVPRALRLALMAAIKTTPGGTITLRSAWHGETLVIRIEGSGLEPQRDDPLVSLQTPAGPHLSGAGLRVAMARDALAPLHGELAIQAGEPPSISFILPAPAAPPTPGG